MYRSYKSHTLVVATRRGTTTIYGLNCTIYLYVTSFFNTYFPVYNIKQPFQDIHIDNTMTFLKEIDHLIKFNLVILRSCSVLTLASANRCDRLYWGMSVIK